MLPTKGRHKYSLPPREITVHLAEKIGIHRKLDPDARAALTLVNHFGYGAMAATIYSLVEGWNVLKGPIFGAMVWLVSLDQVFQGATVFVGILLGLPFRGHALDELFGHLQFRFADRFFNGSFEFRNIVRALP